MTDTISPEKDLKAAIDKRPSFARGYYGLAIYRPKKEVNFGSLLRTAQIFDASFIALIGSRYHRQASDTFGAVHHIPVFEYDSFDSFYINLPRSCQIVAVEQHERAVDLKGYKHPLSAVYLLGAEDDGIPPAILDRCHDLIKLDGEKSMNLAVAGSIVVYHRVSLGVD
ncbi:MAG: TrmH family RNA methyltransferase [Proteobacteria bacterium]|nr:MAG: TrmH family RNA methyltransferase [Pseudomonadota bacterium]